MNKDFRRRDVLELLAGGIGSSGFSGGKSALSHEANVRTLFGVNSIRLMLGERDYRATAVQALLNMLGDRGIRFVRFAASAHWAQEWARFEADPALHWGVLDAIFRAAERSSIQLLPCVLWQATAVAFYCNEPMQAWANPKSKTRALAESYTDSFVDRYDGSNALLMYEFTNELNDWVDLPQVLQFWPKPDPGMPTRVPVEQDRLTSFDLCTISSAFTNSIRRRSSKPISMGSNLPRPNAWHLARGKWSLDTTKQFSEQFRIMTPPQMNVLSAHIYDQDFDSSTPFSGLPHLLDTFVATARQDGRKTLIGEFGVRALPDKQEERARFTAMMEALTKSGADYASLWNVSTVPFQKEWDVSPHNDRGYQLDALAAANK